MLCVDLAFPFFPFSVLSFLKHGTNSVVYATKIAKGKGKLKYNGEKSCYKLLIRSSVYTILSAFALTQSYGIYTCVAAE